MSHGIPTLRCCRNEVRRRPFRKINRVKWNHTRWLLIGLATLLACRPREFAPDKSIQDAPSSLQVLAKANDTYKRLKTYQDEGTSVTTFKSPLGGHTQEIRFTTSYTRGGKFRFEFSESTGDLPETRMVVWKDGETVKSWWSIEPKVETYDDIGLAIAGATGVSGTTAYLVPAVLMDEAAWKGRTWTFPAGAFRIEDGLEGNTSFFRVQRLKATHSTAGEGERPVVATGKVTYWIEKSTFLLARVDEETDFGTFTTKRCIRYSSRIDGAIPDEAFEFGY